MAGYVRMQARFLAGTGSDEILAGRVKFAPPGIPA
jgi:hypothetical protein